MGGAPHVVVATPGRLQDMMNISLLSIKNVRYVVLDEADRMLEMGFEKDIAKILAQVPAERQTLLFTATWPRAVQRIAAKYLRTGAKHVRVGGDGKDEHELVANVAISQEFLLVAEGNKTKELFRIWDTLPKT